MYPQVSRRRGYQSKLLRTPSAVQTWVSNLMKKGRGAFDDRSADRVVALKRIDNTCVDLLSVACGITPLSKVHVPSLIPASNQPMGGIDPSPVQDPSQVKARVRTPVRIHPSPVHLKLLAGLSPPGGEANASQSFPPRGRPL